MFANHALAVADKHLLELDTSFSTSTLEDNSLPRCRTRRTLSETARLPPNSPTLTSLKRFVHATASAKKETSVIAHV